MEEMVVNTFYDETNFKKLISQLDVLNSFDDVSAWDSAAQLEIQKITNTIRKIEIEEFENRNNLEFIRKDRDDKNFFIRIIYKKKEEKEIIELIKKQSQYMKFLGKKASQLQESIDFTPNSSEEQKSLLKELHLRKKELQIKKRQISAAMKVVRIEARQQSAEAGLVFGVLYDSKIAANQRRDIRYAKEAALRPHEDEKAAIERQLLQTDRDIIWAEKFS